MIGIVLKMLVSEKWDVVEILRQLIFIESKVELHIILLIFHFNTFETYNFLKIVNFIKQYYGYFTNEKKRVTIS